MVLENITRDEAIKLSLKKIISEIEKLAGACLRRVS